MVAESAFHVLHSQPLRYRNGWRCRLACFGRVGPCLLSRGGAASLMCVRACVRACVMPPERRWSRVPTCATGQCCMLQASRSIFAECGRLPCGPLTRDVAVQLLQAPRAPCCAAGRSTATWSGTATAPRATCTLQQTAAVPRLAGRWAAHMLFHAPLHARTTDTRTRAHARTHAHMRARSGAHARTHARKHARTAGALTPAQVSAAEGVALQHLQQLRQGVRPPLPVGAHQYAEPERSLVRSAPATAALPAG